MACPRCNLEDGTTQLGGQRFRCSHCSRRFTRRSSSAFSRRAFSDDIITLAVRWYVRYRLSYAEVSEWLAERGILVDRARFTVGCNASCHSSATWLATTASPVPARWCGAQRPTRGFGRSWLPSTPLRMVCVGSRELQSDAVGCCSGSDGRACARSALHEFPNSAANQQAAAWPEETGPPFAVSTPLRERRMTLHAHQPGVGRGSSNHLTMNDDLVYLMSAGAADYSGDLRIHVQAPPVGTISADSLWLSAASSESAGRRLQGRLPHCRMHRWLAVGRVEARGLHSRPPPGSGPCACPGGLPRPDPNRGSARQ